ncbi:MFS transporter [bacterium]|nr:MFS transporter [bacterium]
MSIKRHLIHDEKLNSGKVMLVGFISFMLGFSGSLLLYVMSFYFKQSAGTDNVGIFYLLSYATILVTLLNLHKLVKKFGKVCVFYLAFILKLITITALIFLPFSVWGIISLVVYIIAGALVWVSLDTILESFSEDKSSGKIRGINLTIMNAGIVLGPFISSKILEEVGFVGIFFISLLIHSVIFSVGLIGLKRASYKFRGKLAVKDLIKKVIKRKNVMRIYYISFTLDFFYALMVIFTPLYLLSLGYSWHQLGIIFTIMLIPFVLIQYPMGVLADKKTGEKEFLILAIFVMGISTFIFYCANTPSIVIWTLILLITRIGAALIEILRDSYFYKRIDGHDVDIIDFFRTSRPVAYISAAILSTLILFFFPMKAIFLLVSIIVFSALYPAFRLVDNKSEEEIINGKIAN